MKNLATWNGRVVREVSPDVVIETDTSKTGWGAFCQGILTGGCWNAQEAELHINSLEMLAAFYAIKAFIKNCQGISVLLRTDNMSVVTYVNRMGGTRSPLLTAQAIDLGLGAYRGKSQLQHSTFQGRRMSRRIICQGI